ncbi:MAG TPA: phytanoyl-CoA dioxygenase family protein [Magnetospirillaceae bacterium]|jgi:ectoine hydroxylase-related dioxygenase (phytanoyl-CoA dioxygenase family)
MQHYRLTAEDQDAFERDGFFFVRGLFDKDEIALLSRAMETDPSILGHANHLKDGSGAATRIVLWNHPGDSVYGLAARSRRVVDTMESLLGGEVYHYHSKLTAKDPYEGGAWEWHQDYGYWYANGCLFPLMASCMIALDRSDRDNGCLQVLKGSQAMGRIEHVHLDGKQVGADPARIEMAMQRLELIYCEMNPGDGLFFHSNLLHRSDQNRSARRRWTLLCCYNAARNNPMLQHHHPSYTKLHKVEDDALKQAGLKLADGSGEAFMESVETTADAPWKDREITTKQ